MKPGTRLKSAVCGTEIVVVRGTSADIKIECGGAPMGEARPSGPSDVRVHPDFDGGTAVGKRYADDGTGLMVLCTKGGAGALSVDGRLLPQVAAKPLPASD